VVDHIRLGDTYQVNLTFPLSGSIPSDPGALFAWMRASQQAAYCAHLDLGRFEILSASPELFFERVGTHLITRPMKGTIGRGRSPGEDERLAEALQQSSKARAENVMIVDLLRNDLGRIARTGTVRVPHLFSLERYPTLWQLTSTVTAEARPGTTLPDLFRALFPCGSVTGAPKIRTMQVIAELEQTPRGVYTGAIGLVRPGGDCAFSVAIRTMVLDRRHRTATLGVGAGITADSDPEEEYRECLLKAAFVNGPGDR
jgi:para-aminobenzoate synthetase/4-amino-4-deoxychorismate lyase